MPQNRILIKFEGKGDKPLIAAINKLAKAQDNLNGKMQSNVAVSKKVSKQTGALDSRGKRLAKTNGLLANSFATIRSKMLLVSFAMALGVRQVIDFTKQAAKIQSMETAFTNMSGSVKGAEERLKALKSATNGAMSEFDLFQQANNAMVLGITRNTGEMANMFDAAQRLGRALGRDTASSVESLITGVGRQSRLMLYNIGIIVKADEAYTKYAVTLGKSVDQLTDSEKKQAFFNATMESAARKLTILGEEIPSAQDAVDSMAASFDDISKNIGEAFLPVLETTASLMASLTKSFSPERVKSYLAVLTGVGVAMGIYVLRLKEAVIWQTRLGWGIMATAAGVLGAELLKMSGIFDDSNKSQEDGVSKAVAYMESLKTMKTELLEVQKIQQEYNLTNLEGTEALSTYRDDVATAGAAIEKFKALLQAAKSTGNDFNLQANLQADIDYWESVKDNLEMPEEGKSAARIRGIIAELQIYIETLGKSGLTLNEFNTAQEKANELYNKTPEEQQAAIQGQIDFVKGLDESVISAEKLKEILEMLNLQLDKNANSTTKTASRVGKAFGQMSQAGVALAKGNKEQTIMALELGKAQGLANIYVGATQAIKAKGWLGVLEGIAVIAAGMATIANIDTQIAAVKATKAEQGGLIGGRRHSQGGTMIEAEQGEFVMSRNAVNAVGVEAMNRINAGGGAGAVSINFTGNVMSQDFIEDEAIPMIKEAIRRGADIGVA